LDKLSPLERIQHAKLQYMQKEQKKIDWEEVESNMITSWYMVSKIMAHLIPKTFPWFTFKGIMEEIREDPNYKKKEEK